MKTTLPLPVIYMCCTYINTCRIKPNDAGHFDWPITIRKGANHVAGSRWHLFVYYAMRHNLCSSLSTIFVTISFHKFCHLTLSIIFSTLFSRKVYTKICNVILHQVFQLILHSSLTHFVNPLPPLFCHTLWTLH